MNIKETLLKKETMYLNNILDINSIQHKQVNIKIELDFQEYDAIEFYDLVTLHNASKIIQVMNRIEVIDYINTGITESDNLIDGNRRYTCKIDGNILTKLEPYKANQ